MTAAQPPRSKRASWRSPPPRRPDCCADFAAQSRCLDIRRPLAERYPMSVRSVLLAFALLMLTGCPVKQNALLLEDTLSTYAAAIRWGHMEDALGFVDPE